MNRLGLGGRRKFRRWGSLPTRARGVTQRPRKKPSRVEKEGKGHQKQHVCRGISIGEIEKQTAHGRHSTKNTASKAKAEPEKDPNQQ